MRKLGIILYFALNTIIFLLGFIFRLLQEEAVGGSLLAAGIVGYVIYWASYINMKRSSKEEILLHSLNRFGIIDINERRLIYDKYAEARKKTSKALDIMGFGLRNFIEDNAKNFNEWSKSFTIRILVVNPNSSYCDQRDYEERDPIGKIKSDVIAATKAILELKNQKVKLRWYTAIPVTNILRMDDVMWVGPYFMYERSRNAYVLTLEGKKQLFKQYQAHFDRIWKDPRLSCQPDLSKLT